MLSVVPENDERKHEIGLTCWCEPDVRWLDPDTGLPWGNSAAAPMVIHIAADCREYSEEVTGERMAPNKGWKLVES